MSTPLLAQSDPDAGLVGATAAEFTLPGLHGESVPFPDLAKDGTQRLAVLVFFATWNRFSARECDRLAKLWPRWSQSGVKVVGINVEGSAGGKDPKLALERWLEEHPLPYPVALDRDLEAFRAYGVVAVPTTVVVDDTGKIVIRLAGYPVGGSEQLLLQIEQRLIADKTSSGRRPASASSADHRRATRYLRLARVLIQKGEQEMAEYTLRRSIREAPDLIEARIDLAALYDRTGRPADADATLEEATRKFPEDSMLLLARARARLLRGDLDQAEALASEALERNPSLTPCLTLLGKVHLSRGSLDRALSAFKDATKRNPLDPEPIVQAGEVYERKGQKLEALNHYLRAYDLMQGGQ